MSDEDRSQAPSKRRRMLARERGLVPRSSELTAAAALLAGVLLLGAWGDDLVASLVGGLRGIGESVEPMAADAAGVAAQIRAATFAVVGPLAAIFGGVALAAVAAHQAQVGGLWLPGLLAPDAARLWSPGQFGRIGAGSARGLWSVAKVAIILVVAGATLGANRDRLGTLGQLATPALVVAVGSLLRSLLGTLAVALIALGAADYWLQHRRIEALLLATPEENREDQKAIEGDPSLRSRRRRMAESRRFDPIEAVAGAKLALLGPGGLTLVLGGGPPGKRRILVRAAAKGSNGRRLLRAAEDACLPIHEAADLARHLARSDRAPLPVSLAEELAALWPAGI